MLRWGLGGEAVSSSPWCLHDANERMAAAAVTAAAAAAAVTAAAAAAAGGGGGSRWRRRACVCHVGRWQRRTHHLTWRRPSAWPSTTTTTTTKRSTRGAGTRTSCAEREPARNERSGSRTWSSGRAGGQFSCGSFVRSFVRSVWSGASVFPPLAANGDSDKCSATRGWRRRRLSSPFVWAAFQTTTGRAARVQGPAESGKFVVDPPAPLERQDSCAFALPRGSRPAAPGAASRELLLNSRPCDACILEQLSSRRSELTTSRDGFGSARNLHARTRPGTGRDTTASRYSRRLPRAAPLKSCACLLLQALLRVCQRYS